MTRLAFLFTLGFSVAPLFGAVDPARTVDFQRDVRPILADNCFACHGPDSNTRQAGLRLDTREGAFSDRGGYRVIVPGDAKASRLFGRMSHPEAIARMPPQSADRHPTPSEVEMVGRWIDEGAQWSSHWAYQPAARPAVPEVEDTSRLVNEIDSFVVARLEEEGLALSPEAQKATLLRRLSFDLTGLPPNPPDVAAFVGDADPNAYEKQVDRLLESVHYGERMALLWMDLARYADTHGFHIDGRRDMWQWRDWVISSFNDNKPFDVFTIEQLAGDLLPEPTLDQKIATGFNRNHMINHEGGAIPAEYHTEYVVDRVETVSTVWMAMTMGCARCHDHKYDPITQREFYEFYAFFNSVDELGLDGVDGNAVPKLQLPSASQEARLAQLDEAMRSIQADLPEDRIRTELAEWEETAARMIPSSSRVDLEAHYEMEGSLADSSGRYRHGRILRGEPLFATGKAGRESQFDVDTHVAFPGTDAIDLAQPFTVALWIRPTGFVDMSLLHKMDGPESRRGLEMTLSAPVSIPDALRREYHLTLRLSSSPGSALVARTRKPLRDVVGEDATYHIAVSYDGSARADGLGLHVNGEPADFTILSDSLSGSPASEGPFEIGAARFGNRFTGSLDDLRIYSRVLDTDEVGLLFTHEPVRSMLGEPYLDCRTLLAGAPPLPADDIYAPKPDTDVSKCRERTRRLREYYLTHAAEDTDLRLYARLQEMKRERSGLQQAVPNVMVMQELPEPRETFMLARGDYRNRADRVSPATPAWLSEFPKEAPRDRLGLARWIVSPGHPLTARVAVNHYWQLFFGQGLVKTSEDFGLQGELPSHPELLDWLATEFEGGGWDIKALLKTIVMSATYRQRSNTTVESLARDPENRLLARGPRYRLPAELVRDNALAVSGLLDDRVGGPSVFPYQPDGLWKEMAFGDMFTAQVYRPGSGSDLYRRSMYTFWKRTVPPPSLGVFDAPDREKCIARRSRTNTPLQALVLMNDPTYVEASRVLAERMVQEAGPGVAERVRFAYERVLARTPAETELRLLGDLAREQMSKFEAAPGLAGELLEIGESPVETGASPAELAAWTIVASSILNLDETISKE